MVSSNAHSDVHEAGAPTISSLFMSGMIASVVGEPEGLGQRQDVALDLAVDLLVGLRVVEVVADVLGDVDVVAADAAVLVDPLPERLLRLGDRHAERRERPWVRSEMVPR